VDDDYESQAVYGTRLRKAISWLITALLLPGILLMLWLLMPETFGPTLKEHWRWATAAYVITIVGIYSFRSTEPGLRKARGAFWIVTLFLTGGFLVFKQSEEARIAQSDPNWARCRWNMVEHQRGRAYTVDFTPQHSSYAYFIRLPGMLSWRTTCADNLRITYQTLDNRVYEVDTLDKVPPYNRCVFLELKQLGACKLDIRWSK
jgi:hypothetical protein